MQTFVFPSPIHHSPSHKVVDSGARQLIINYHGKYPPGQGLLDSHMAGNDVLWYVNNLCFS